MLLIVCPLVFLAGLIDSVAGGGGLISLPAYLAAGIPPHMALGTNKCSSCLGTIFSTARFMKNGKIHYLSALCAAAAALLGSYIGASLTLIVDESVLRYLMIGVLPVIAVFLLVRRNFGESDRTKNISSLKVVILSILSGLLIGMYDGFFGPGTGTFLILVFTGVIGFDLVTSSGNAKIVNLASNIAALVTFAASGSVLWKVGLPAALFGIAGHWIGSGLALKNGAKVIRPMFFAALTILFAKLIYDAFLS